MWGVFNIVSNLRDLVAIAMQLLATTAPFFVLAYASRRWSRVAGGLLVALSVFFLSVYFGTARFDRLALVVKVSTAVLSVGPLLASGVALLQPREEARALAEEAV